MNQLTSSFSLLFCRLSRKKVSGEMCLIKTLFRRKTLLCVDINNFFLVCAKIFLQWRNVKLRRDSSKKIESSSSSWFIKISENSLCCLRSPNNRWLLRRPLNGMNDAFRPDPNALDIDIEFNALVVNVCQFQFNLKINICPFHSYIEVIEGEKSLVCLSSGAKEMWFKQLQTESTFVAH